MEDIRHPSKPFHRNDTNLDETLVSEEDSKEEDYHSFVSQNPWLLKYSKSLINFDVFSVPHLVKN